MCNNGKTITNDSKMEKKKLTSQAPNERFGETDIGK